MNCCILITREEVLNPYYRLNNLGIWQIGKVDIEKLSKIETGYVYFTEAHGIARKLKVNLSDKKIAYLVKEKLYNPITLIELRKNNIIDDDDMQGAIRYLDTDKTKKLNALWYEKHNAE
jgi:hypothetical protein